MKGDSEEGDRQYNRELMLTNPDWLDLPEPVVTNIILEHLELVDYIRFSAVCKKWHSIQKEHRISYSPHPPPFPLPFPWLICNVCSREYNNNLTIVFHLLDKQRTYEIPIFRTQIIGYRSNYRHGWLPLFTKVDDINRSLCIVNPVTGVQIKLPPFLIPMPDLTSTFCISRISSPPTDPDCTVLVMCYFKAYLYRLNNNSGWKTIQCSRGFIGSTIFCHSKIYRSNDWRRLYMVDTLPSDSVEQTVEMDCSEICEALRFEMFDLVDFFGELVMVITEYIGDEDDIIKEFYVYKADFLTSKWVRIKSLGEYALFFSSGSTFPLLANEIGCKKNTIYTAEGFLDRVAWRAFNLSTKDWIDGPSSSLTCDYHLAYSYSWFLPALDYFCDHESGRVKGNSGSLF